MQAFVGDVQGLMLGYVKIVFRNSESRLNETDTVSMDVHGEEGMIIGPLVREAILDGITYGGEVGCNEVGCHVRVAENRVIKVNILD